MIMTSKQNSRPGKQGGTHEQHVQAGQQSHKNSGSQQSAASDNMLNLGNLNQGSQSGGVQGGSHEQHVRAGQQSHKNSGSQQSASRSDSRQQSPSQGSQQSASGSNQQSQSPSSGTRGGTPEQHAAAGRQSHKNSR
jgi:hypothetical protein